jgi:CRISPR-associated protein Cmr1
MAWPRAGFGLPIVGEIRGRNEPGKFELRWRSVGGEHGRFASPLIVKALPLADGRFAPCALWLDRALPPDSVVGLGEEITVNGQIVRRVKPGTEAKFEPGSVHPLLARGDTPLFAPLAKQPNLSAAFCHWLATAKKAARVAP